MGYVIARNRGVWSCGRMLRGSILHRRAASAAQTSSVVNVSCCIDRPSCRNRRADSQTRWQSAQPTRDSQTRGATTGEHQICTELREMYSRGQVFRDRAADNHAAPHAGLLQQVTYNKGRLDI